MLPRAETPGWLAGRSLGHKRPATNPGATGHRVDASNRLGRPSGRVVRAGERRCGHHLGDVQRHARAAGLEYGADLASRDSATIGGTVATNAGGIRVLAYGMTRLQVTGIEAVLPDGSVISHMSGLAKDNTGFDLAQRCGSEGALAIITAIRLRLHRPHGRTSVALIGCSDYDDALTVIGSATQGRLVAAEVIDATGMQLVQDVRLPIRSNYSTHCSRSSR